LVAEKFEKNIQNKTTKRFSFGNTKVKGVLNPNFRPFNFELKKKVDFLK